METLSDLKKSLKHWESQFYKEHNRKPKQEDIQEAPENIKVAYSQYNQLRKQEKARKNSSDTKEADGTKSTNSAKGNNSHGAADKHENKNIACDHKDKEGQENFSGECDNHQMSNNDIPPIEAEVWGKQFDRKITNSSSKSKPKTSNSKKNNVYLKGLGSKLFANSKKIGEKDVKEQAIISRQWKQSLQQSVSIATPFKDDEDSFTCFSDETDDMDKMASDHQVSKETDDDSNKFGMFRKAVSLSSKKTSLVPEPIVDEVIVSSKYSTTCKVRNQIPVLPKSASYEFNEPMEDEVDGNVKSDFIEKVSELNSPVLKKMRHRNPEYVSREREENSNPSLNNKQTVSKVGGNQAEETNIKTKKTVQKGTHETSTADTTKKVLIQKTSQKSADDTIPPVSTSKPQIRRTTQKWTGETVTPDCVPMETEEPKEMDDIPVIPKQNRKRKKDKCEDGAQRKRKKAETVENDLPTDDTEVASGGEDVKGSTVSKKPSSVGTGRKVSQDNFVRLNMKVKTYKRKGGKGMTGPQHKRFMWKQKMAARNASRGDNCFKCGQPGHWANKCPGGSSKSGGGDRHEEPINEEDFPSLQEAAMMAKGIKVKRSEVKKEKKVTKVQENTKGHSEYQGHSHYPSEDEEDIQIQAGITRSAPEDIAAPPRLSPLIEPGTQVTPAEVLAGLKMFGFDGFRRGQEQAVMRILSGLSTLVVLSTGGGKSLCYQLPAYLYAQRSKSITLVISPLVSLMEDQITGLPAGLHGACLHTNMTPAQREGVLASVKDGRVHFLLVSPEAVAGGSMSLLNSQANLPPISFVCIDEAHCLSEWSHNFRPAYLRLCKVLRDKFGVHCFLGLTATATQSTAADVAKHIGIEDCEDAVIRGPPVPRNLFLSVSRDEDRDQSLIGMLQGERFSECESIIIYCTRREQTERLATLIRTCLKEEKSQDWEDSQSKKKGGRKKYAFWDAESYHAGLSPAQRKRVQNAFMSGRLRVVVATVAFGMGLDKSNVRGIIHYNLPKSFESYVQEIGRAGRDGQDSHCHLFLDAEGKDLCELRRHTYANTVDYRTLKKFLQYIFIPCHCKAVQKLQEQAQREKEECEQTASLCVTDWDDADTGELSPVGDTGITTSDGDTLVPTLGRDTKVQSQDGDTGVRTPQADTQISTPEGDTRVPTPEGDTRVPTPEGDTRVPTPEGLGEKEECEQTASLCVTDWDDADTGELSPVGDTGITTSDGDTLVPTLGRDTKVQSQDGDTGRRDTRGVPEPTPEGDTRVPTPEGDTRVPTPEGDTRVPTPEGDTGTSVKPRICPGHERAIPIEDTVSNLDVKEEGLCTLMCYLENHSQMWLQSMANVYANCHIQCYGGPSHLQKLAKKCPPVAVAIARAKKNGKTFSDTNSLSFSVIEVSDCMGWSSGPVKRELKTLAWDFNRPGTTGPVRSGVLVEFSDLAFHFRSPGDLDDDELDDVLQFLHDRVQTQEKTEIQQLKYLYNTLRSVSHKNYWMCSDEFDKRKDEKLKVVIVDYFQEQTLLKQALEEADDTPEVPQYELGQLVSDIRQFVNVYGTEHKLNGRAIARVFHGIGSPCFPANVWGRNRRYWRAHMNVDFNMVVKIATKELISMR
ncbi:ATP-dependent DNA helicase Q4-like [Argopecten irradians]|uniref:ATP-dependent DNA helicase Q4-like n=1 Tax=Argopecten irradians TaxID=31199 RepID=UPI00371E5546